jgi:hypothetical protein
MTSPFMNEMAKLIAERGVGVSRFDFDYMVRRRLDGKRRPPPKAENLIDEFLAAVDALSAFEDAQGHLLLVGGKSMGGRVATYAADALYRARRIGGAVVLGYPFHPPGKPQTLRTAHLAALAAPLLIVQGERDPFGTRAEIEGFELSPMIQFSWAHDGDHDLGPRGGQATTRKANLTAAAEAIAAFASHALRAKS